MQMKLKCQECTVLFLQLVLFQLCASSRLYYDLGDSTKILPNNGHPRAPCPEGWVMNPNKTMCVRYVRSPRSWYQSEGYCRTYYDAHLGVPETVQELGFYQKLCNYSYGCWLGGRGRRNDSVLFGWNWHENSSVWTRNPFNSSVDLCMAVLNKGSVLVITETCNKSHPFTCMINVGKKCLHMRCHRSYLIGLAAVSGLILCVMSIIVVWLLLYKRNSRDERSQELSKQAISEVDAPSWMIFTKDEIRSFRKNFGEGSRLPGDSRTGSTYIGILPDGVGSRVAIKRLRTPFIQSRREFYSEITKVYQLHHPNLASVIGCCYNHGTRYVVYAYTGTGSLDGWLHHMPKSGRILDWAERIKIVTTLAQAITFLHDMVKPHVVHQDVRASNVLIDEEFGAHLIGTGLSKFMSCDLMHERIGVTGGNYGYLAPEFVYRNETSTKSDVYSFGVLLLEVVCGRRPSEEAGPVGWQSVFEWATPLVQSRRYAELLDPLIASSSYIPQTGIIQKVVDLVYSCTHHVPARRPRMSHVVHQLMLLTHTKSAG